MPTSRYENAHHEHERSAADRRDYDSRVHRLEAITENIAQGLTALTDDVRALSQIMREGNKTNWSVLATWAGVLLALIMAIGSGFIKEPLTRLSDDYYAHSIYQRDVNDDERVWRRDYLSRQAGIDTEQFKDIESLKDATAHLHVHTRETNEKLQEDAVHMGALESRVQAIERSIFADARYRGGKPD